MTDEQKRDKLVGFLDSKVFEPILRAAESGRNHDELEHVKRSTESEKKRFHESYATASEVRNNYLSDLSSSAGKRISGELEELGLPSLPKVKDEFMKLADDLGVGPH